MKKYNIFITATLLAGLLCGCTNTDNGDVNSTKDEQIDYVSTSEEKITDSAADITEEVYADSPDKIRIGSLKGPTSMGIVNMEYENYMGDLSYLCEYFMAVQADEIVTKIVKSELDIALIPANLASVLYNKTDGEISVIDINTLGVLYIVESGESIKEISDLSGKTIYMTGKGTTPDFAFQYLLSKNDIGYDDVTVEYKSEATEVAALLSERDDAVGLLPQPFVTTAMMNNENLRIALDLTQEWDKVSDSSLVTGVTVVRNEFLKQYPEAVNSFILAHIQSVETGKENLDITCERIEDKGIIKAEVAKRAYDYCNIVCITGHEMETALSGYLAALYELEPSSVGGSLPDNDFYYFIK